VDRLRQLPVDAATLARYLPGRGGADVDLTVPGVPPPPGLPFFTATWNAVDPEFFTTLRIPIVAGRDFNAADQEGSQPVAIVGEAAARQFWPGQDAIGKYLQWHEGRRNQPGTVTTVQVVGVVRDLRSPEVTARGPAPQRRVEYRSDGRQLTVADPASLMIYVPLAQRPSTRLTLLVRGTGRPLAGDIRRLVNSIDPNLPLILPERLDAQRGPVYVQLQVAAAVAGSVGLVGLLLAAIGIYGVTSYNTARRTREMGIRIALGAKHTDTVRMVMRQGMSLVLSGALIGLIVAAVGTRLFEGLLFGVPPNDPVTFGGAALLFAVVGFAACYVPARRAARVDPMVALRCE
jgi:predicted permease